MQTVFQTFLLLTWVWRVRDSIFQGIVILSFEVHPYKKEVCILFQATMHFTFISNENKSKACKCFKNIAFLSSEKSPGSAQQKNTHSQLMRKKDILDEI